MEKKLVYLQYHKVSNELRGKTRRYLYEVHPNVFTGTLSTRVREELWKKIVETGEEALLIYPCNNEQGFCYRSTFKSEPFIDLDGVLLPCCKKEITELVPYAKPDQKLIEHLMETGNVAEALLTQGRAAHCVEALSEQFGIPKGDMINFICFLCASHDIGKTHPGFLRKMALHPNSASSQCHHMYELLERRGFICEHDAPIRHERYSFEIIKGYLSRIIDPELASSFSRIVAFHHQGKEGSVNDKTYCYKEQDERWNDWKEKQKEYMDRILERWPVSDRINDLLDQRYINGLSFIILSIMINCDWITSSADWKNCTKNSLNTAAAAKMFIEQHMLVQKHIKDILSEVKWEDICKYSKNECQRIISGLKEGYRSLTIIEAPCGYGKTLTAMLCCLKFGAFLSGIFFATPTMSTAKSLALDLRKFIEMAGLNILLPELDSSMIWSTEEMAKIPAELWTSRSRHQLLYPYAVGTVDQILKAVTYHRYSVTGLIGLSDKAIVIDEVHAYDEYMITEIEILIRYCCFMKVPVILLSATLPKKTKLRLFKAAGIKNDVEISCAYPLISYVEGKELVQIPIEAEGRIFGIYSKTCKDVQEELYQYGLHHEEGIMALITATVDDAFDLYYRLEKDVKDAEILLYQGRDSIRHKSDKVRYLSEHLGRNRKKRLRKMIIVATGIMEQSLNIDVDIMITELAPIDLLIQRLGRVWRFEDAGTVREKKKIEIPFTILCPETYGSLSKIYDKTILQNTQNVLARLDQIHTVKDVRELIDTVYENAPEKYSSEIRSAAHCFSTPAGDTVSLDMQAYQNFETRMPMTREERYPSVPVAILPELKSEYDFEEIQYIRENYVVSVPEYKLKAFEAKRKQCSIKQMEDLYIYVDPDLNIQGDGKMMCFTDLGLEIRDHERE